MQRSTWITTPWITTPWITTPWITTPWITTLCLAALFTLAWGPRAHAYDIGDTVADARLDDSRGQSHSLASYRGQVLVLVFWGSQCPSSQGYAERLSALATRWGNRVTLLGVASNAYETPPGVEAARSEQDLSLPILMDDGGSWASNFGAFATPTACVIDAQGVLQYRGAIDDDPRGRGYGTTPYLAEAITAVLAQQPPARPRTRVEGARINP